MIPNDWIAFYSNGEVCIDVVLMRGKSHRYPHDTYALTPRHGRISESSIIETRTPADILAVLMPQERDV